MPDPEFFPGARYEDAPAAIEWLCGHFGFEQLIVVPGEAGDVAHAELALEGGVFMLSSLAHDIFGMLSPASAGGITQSVYVGMPDVEEHYRRAVASGAEITRPIEDTEYGSREYSARDCEGHHWSFGTFRPVGEGYEVPSGAIMYPVHRYADGPKAIDWLCAAFGFERLFVVEDEGGTIGHGELSLGPAVLMLGSFKSDTPFGFRTPAQAGGTTGDISVYIDDVDAHYARATAAGAQVAYELHDTDYGARMYSARDLEGHLWTFGNYRPER